jgi:hypothetical protein
LIDSTPEGEASLSNGVHLLQDDEKGEHEPSLEEPRPSLKFKGKPSKSLMHKFKVTVPIVVTYLPLFSDAPRHQRQKDLFLLPNGYRGAYNTLGQLGDDSSKSSGVITTSTKVPGDLRLLSIVD